MKVSIIGSGNVGVACALYLAEKKVANITLIDIVDDWAKGKAMDIVQASPIRRYDVYINGYSEMSMIKDSDVIVVTAGKPRLPGMSREDLVKDNVKIMKSVSEEIAKYAPNAVVITVTNPLDILAYVALKVTGFALKKVIGMAGVLDSSRFRYFIADELGVSPLNVTALVLGGHGDLMVPLPRYSTVHGIPVTELLPRATIEKLVTRTRKAGGEIVAYLKTGSAYWSPGSSAAEMVECVVRNRNRILPCSAYLRGEYGIDGLFSGVPIKIGRGGVEEIIELSLTTEEKDALHLSAAKVREAIEKIESEKLI
ncbi:MAG TPA: malate dehydrogenase [Candidatus Cloacimonetes bacterium]|nr:malate dehydrogenase [Candidatus Cloacimonadota bacterium]